jgi:hypothetical protein
MEQIAVSFTDWWVPKTWLSPKVTILGKDWTVFIQNWECRELGYGWYIYNFAKYSPEKVYLYVFDGGSALSSDYDRYKFGGNEFDAYSNKYSWGRTAAPYFTSINGRFDKVDKLFKDAEKNRYNDSEVKKAIREVKNEIKGKGWFDVYEKLSEIQNLIETVNSSIKEESSTKWVSDINGKLDLMAEYVLKMKEDIDNWLDNVWEAVSQSIQESNANLNEWMASRATTNQLLQQTDRLENKMDVVLDAFVKTHMEWMLPKDITDRYDVNLSKKQMSDEDIMSALWIPTNDGNQYWLNQWMSEWMEMWMEEGMSEWLGEERPASMNAPVDMQWIAEPEMPMWAM